MRYVVGRHGVCLALRSSLGSDSGGIVGSRSALLHVAAAVVVLMMGPAMFASASTAAVGARVGSAVVARSHVLRSTVEAPTVGVSHSVLAGALGLVTPFRVLDTRSGVGAPRTVIGPGASVTVQVEGVGGVPATGVAAVVVNVTAVSPTRAGYLAAFAAARPSPVSRR